MQPCDADGFLEGGPASYLVYVEDPLDHLVWRLSMRGWRCLLIDRNTAADKQMLLDALATGLGFPDWFGRNWDGLIDLLREWSDRQPVALLIADLSAAGDHESAGDDLAVLATLVDIIDTIVVEGRQIKLGVVPHHDQDRDV